MCSSNAASLRTIETSFADHRKRDSGCNRQLNTQTQSIASVDGNPGFLFQQRESALGNNLTTGTVRPQVSSEPKGLSNFSLGRVLIVTSVSVDSFSQRVHRMSTFLLRALAARRQVHVLSRPQVTTTDNVSATIDVGTEVGILEGVTVDQAAIIPNIAARLIGIALTVTPRVTDDGRVVMSVVANNSGFAGDSDVVYTDVNSGAVFERPRFNTTTANATLSVQNGQTVVLGGLIQSTEDTIERKVPWLGDIPFIGQPFRYDSTSTTRKELLIFLTPRVIRTDADAEVIKQIEAERLHFVEEEAEAMHGPLYAAPARGNMVPGASAQSEMKQEMEPLAAPPVDGDQSYRMETVPPYEAAQTPTYQRMSHSAETAKQKKEPARRGWGQLIRPRK